MPRIEEKEDLGVSDMPSSQLILLDCVRSVFPLTVTAQMAPKSQVTRATEFIVAIAPDEVKRSNTPLLTRSGQDNWAGTAMPQAGPGSF